MSEVADLKYKIGKFYSFTAKEIRGFLIATVILAFVISFNKWGDESFDLGEGLVNLFNSMLIVALSLLVNDAGKRLWGLMIGYRIEFKVWTYGLLFALIMAFVTRGSIFSWIIVPGGFMVHHLAGHRLGWFRYGINYFGQGMVAFGGCLFTLTLIILLKILNALAPSSLIETAIMFNVVFLILNMLPIPPLDGSKIYFGSRMMYMFVTPAIICAAILMVLKIPVFLALVISLLIGTVLWIMYYVSFENKVWTGPK